MSVAMYGPSLRTGCSAWGGPAFPAVYPSAPRYEVLDNPVLREVMTRWDQDLSVPMDATHTWMRPRDLSSALDRTLVVQWEALGKDAVRFVTFTVSMNVAVGNEAHSTVLELAEQFGVPRRDILRASGISRRTFHSWAKSGVRPRLGSQGDLWQLRDTLADITQILGTPVDAWMRASRDRRTLLTSGDLDGLVADAYLTRAKASPVLARPGPSSAVGVEADTEVDVAPRTARRGVPARAYTLADPR